MGCRFLEKLQLGGGLEVVLLAEPGQPFTTVHLRLRTGAAWDPVGRSGLSHLCEHLAYDGLTKGAPTFGSLLRRVGGKTSAATSHDSIVFADTLPASELDLALWIAAQRLSIDSSDLRRERLAVEQDVLIQEHHHRDERLTHEKPLQRLSEVLFPPGHPYSRSPGGEPQELRATSCEEVASHLEVHFQPTNALLVIQGGVADQDVFQRVVHHLDFEGAAQAPPPPRAQPCSPTISRPEQRAKAIDLAGGEERLYVALPTDGFGRPAWYLELLWVRALAVGSTSPLRRRLIRDLAVVRDLRVVLDPRRERGILILIATPVRGLSSQELAELLLSSLDDFAKKGVEDSWIQKAKRRALADHYLGIQRVARRAELTSLWATWFDNPEAAFEEADRLTRLEAEEVGAFAAGLVPSKEAAALCITERGIA